MVVLINICRLAMLGWIAYALVLIFAPSWLHHAPDQVGGIIQCVIAYTGGFLLDRLLGVLRRRRLAQANVELRSGEPGGG